jgi:hypothetical protein
MANEANVNEVENELLDRMYLSCMSYSAFEVFQPCYLDGETIVFR